MSSLFILSSLPLARLTCVDTWQGADEHQDSNSDFFNGDISQGVQQDFDANLREYNNRLTKYQGTSFSFFNQCVQNFDLVYIDGSHLADDVVIDAVKGFERLTSGGIMIFDDYLFKYYQRACDNPAAAINWFLRQKAGSYRILSANWQVVLEKTTN
jgi:hypothetical protein